MTSLRNVKVKVSGTQQELGNAFLAAIPLLAQKNLVQELYQIDKFYLHPDSETRAKLREEEDLTLGEKTKKLIIYKRPNKEIRTSEVLIENVDEKETKLKELFKKHGLAEEVVWTVEKHRTVLLLRRAFCNTKTTQLTRFHFDVVQYLGKFIELEVTLDHDEPEENGKQEIEQLLVELKLSENTRVEGAYVNYLPIRCRNRLSEDPIMVAGNVMYQYGSDGKFLPCSPLKYYVDQTTEKSATQATTEMTEKELGKSAFQLYFDDFCEKHSYQMIGLEYPDRWYLLNHKWQRLTKNEYEKWMQKAKVQNEKKNSNA